MPKAMIGGMHLRRLTVYPWHTGKLTRPMRILVVSDLHDGEYSDLLPMLSDVDALLLPGDVANRYRQRYSRGFAFVEKAAEQVPTYIGVGNHEVRLRNFDALQADLSLTRAKLLFNRYERLGELVIGGWYRPETYGHPDMLPAMQAETGLRILMCHHPEDYMCSLRTAQVDLVLAGHAHGGQIRLFGQGLYAPGQGIFPRYTRGVVDDRMIVSAGATTAVFAPRWGNPCEVLIVELD